MITCEHCGSPLPDGAIFCGECGRAVSTGATKRAAAPAEPDRATPPPLQAPDPFGRRRRDPASEAWLPEATLDPATRAWLTAADRAKTGQVDPVPVVTPEQHRPDAHPPRTAPTHVHGSASGVDDWAQDAAEPPLDPDAFPSVPQPQIDPEDESSVSDATPAVPTADDRIGGAPSPWSPEAAAGPFRSGPRADEPRADEPRGATAPSVPAAPAQPTPPVQPAAPSWWVDRSKAAAALPPTDDARPVQDIDRVDAPSTEADAEADARPRPDAVAPAAPDLPVANDTAVVTPVPDARRRPVPLVQPGSAATTCHVCGHTLEPDDIFCDECGAVRGAVTAAFTGPVVPLPVERPDWAASDDDLASEDEVPDAEASAATHDRSADHAPVDAGPADSAPAGSARAGSTPVEAASPVEVPRPGSATLPSSAPRAEPMPQHTFVAPLPPVPSAGAPDAAAWPAPVADVVPTSADADESATLDEDVEETRIVSKAPQPAPFILHCSTGERIAVSGTGLFGRLPRPEAGERFDDLLTIRDPGKSVSKTHLELGRDGDDLWVSDRFSGNGTVVRHIDGSIRRCEPGRRYRVERGARVDIGEQFFLVQ